MTAAHDHNKISKNGKSPLEERFWFKKTFDTKGIHKNDAKVFSPTELGEKLDKEKLVRQIKPHSGLRKLPCVRSSRIPRRLPYFEVSQLADYWEQTRSFIRSTSELQRFHRAKKEGPISSWPKPILPQPTMIQVRESRNYQPSTNVPKLTRCK